MKIQMITLYADAERSVQPGQVALFPPDKAEALIAGGYARAVGEGEVRTRPVEAAKTRGRKQPAKQDPGQQPEDPEQPVKGPDPT